MTRSSAPASTTATATRLGVRADGEPGRGGDRGPDAAGTEEVNDDVRGGRATAHRVRGRRVHEHRGRAAVEDPPWVADAGRDVERNRILIVRTHAEELEQGQDGVKAF